MKRLAVFALFLLLAVSLSVAETPVERFGQLAVDGNRLVSKETGKPVQLRGMSFFWSMAGGGEGCGHYNANVVNTLADDWKVNVIRAAMGVDENWGTSSLGYRVGNKACGTTNDSLVKRVVNAAIDRGIYAIIDYHSHNAHTYPDTAKKFFQEMASKYKGVPNVLYEIYNEPTAAGANSWKNSVKPYAEKIIAAIREIDPNNVIIVGTPLYCQDVDIATANPIEGNNIIYTLHFYSATHKDTLRIKARTALNTNKKALFVSEFGVSNAQANPPLDTAEATKWLNFLDSNMVSWVNWSISDKDKNDKGVAEITSAIVKGGGTNGGWTTDKLTTSGNYIRNKLIAAQQREEEEWATATLAAERAVPKTQQTGGSAAIAPVGAASGSFSAGPVPASKAASGIKFFWQGKAVKGGSLLIYDVLGNRVKSVGISDVSGGGISKRTVGSWDLTDSKGRRVAAGSYLLKGKIAASDGNVAHISSIIVISD